MRFCLQFAILGREMKRSSFLCLAGGDSFACPLNNGASGTRYDIFSSSLRVSNGNKETATDTLLLEFPNHPLWSEVIVENNASVLVPLLWSRVQVHIEVSCSSILLSFPAERLRESFLLLGDICLHFMQRICAYV